LETDVPADKDVPRGEVLEPDLTGTWSVEEEVLDLFSVQVAVLIECNQDGDIASGEGADEDRVTGLSMRKP
jgi:hypothetical protein